MFNGYHETSATSYNDLELDRGKKNQSASKWICGNGTSLQSTHLHPQNQQTEIWGSKPPFIELPNTASQKCSCPSCYQLPESQSYQGEIPWHRSWFSRTYPVSVNATHDIVKYPTNHHWENASFASEVYPDPAGGQFVQEGGDKPLFYKPFTGLRHELYQPGVISTVKKVSRKQDLPKQDEVLTNVGHHPRYGVTNPSYDSFRTVMDQRMIEERNNYCNQNEKFLNAESCRQQSGLGPYGLNPNRRTMLESFSKTVPLNTNQNRVPSAEHRNIKDNDFHSYIDQNSIEKPGPPNINQGGTEDKHCKTYFQSDVNCGQENLHAGLMNVFSSGTTDYHGINLNRELPDARGKEFQKFANGRNPQYFPRNNISDMINRNTNTALNYNINRKGVINIPSGSVRAAQTPPKHAEIVSKLSNFGKDYVVPDKISSGQKMMVNNSANMPPEHFHKGNEISKSENILHGHITRPIVDANPPDKIYNNCVSPQNTMYKGFKRQQEYPYGRRNVQRSNDYSNGMITLRSDLPVGVNIGVTNYPDFRKGVDAYPRVNNSCPHDCSPHQFEKLHYQISGENKPQNSLLGGPQLPPKAENFRTTEKEIPGRISHLEAIPYEELCKNGTSKISPLRLLRKKKVIQQKKEDVTEINTAGTITNTKSSSPPLDVRRFWATWAEEEEDNLLQTQMVVLDCHNIDPEEAGLLHLYNPENIRTVNVEDGNVLDVKGTYLDKENDQGIPAHSKISSLDEKFSIVSENEKLETVSQYDVKVSVNDGNVGKKQPSPDFSLHEPHVVDPVKDSTQNTVTKTNVIVQPNNFTKITQSQPSDDVKQWELFRHKEIKWDDDFKGKYSNIEKPVLNKAENIPAGDSEKTADEKENEGCVGKEEFACSDSSDDSQAECLPSLPHLPTSEYRKNKFLDYSDDNFSNGALLESITSASNKETSHRKQTDERDCPVEDKLKDFLTSEIGPRSFEIDDILKKLSDINFQGADIKSESPGLDDSLDKYKTDKKILDSKTEKKIKKLSHKSSRTDQVTLQNISLTKPTIKFSIQKSHDLKISFKVLNNKKKHDENDENTLCDEDNQEDNSTDCFEDGAVPDRLKKNKRRLITLKLKGVSDGNDEGNLWDEEDSARRSKKGLKKKKVRLDRSPSPKAPVLKIKKSRYMLTYGCESEKVLEASDGTANAASESKDSVHGDFQVHETVDSAKIKLTFKRNRNGGDKKEKSSENDDMMDVRSKSSPSENELTTVTGLCLEKIAGNFNSAETLDDREPMIPSEYFKDEKEESNEEILIDSTVGEREYTNNEESDPTAKVFKSNEEETVELICNPDSLMMDDFKREDITVDPLDIVQSHRDTPLPEDLNLLPGDYMVNMPEVEQYEALEKNTTKDLAQPKIDSIKLRDDILSIDIEGKGFEKNTEELKIGESEDEVFRNLSKLKDDSGNNEIVNDMVNENCFNESILNRVAEEPVLDILDLSMENKSEDGAEESEKKHEVDDSMKSIVVNIDDEDKKLDGTLGNCPDRENQECKNFTLMMGDINQNAYQQSPMSTHEDDKEIAGSTVQLECERIDVTDYCDGLEKRNDTDESFTGVDSLCDLDPTQGTTKNITRSKFVEELHVESNNIKQVKTEVSPDSVGSHDSECKLKKVCTSETMKRSEDYNIVVSTNVDRRGDEDSDEMGAGDMDVGVCEIEQNNSEKKQSILTEVVVEDTQTEEANRIDVVVSQKSEPEIEDIFEVKNDNVRLQRQETVFIGRKILRRCSAEDTIPDQGTKIKRVAGRSTSLNIELTIDDFGKPEITVLDIAVADIPLPPGDAPPENCLNLEDYFKSKLLDIENKADAQCDVTLPKSLLVVKGSKSHLVVEDVCEPKEATQCEAVPEDIVSCDIDDSMMKEVENQPPCGECVTVKKEEHESTIVNQQKDSENSYGGEETNEIRIEDLEVFETRDTEITLEESSFRADQLYECEGLALDEALTITDEMEEEKVSDDDKFRNIMQNCLDNAKKFLSVGNKLLSCSVDDLLEVDSETEAKKVNIQVSKNITLTSCEESDDLIMPNSRHQSLDMSGDFVSSFSADPSSHPCSEILPVDNWPYLEEEVASSPIGNKEEDSDLLYYLDDISSMESLTYEGKFSTEKMKRRRSLHSNFDSGRNTRLIPGRRRTIEGIGQWNTFRSTDEELSDVENFILRTEKNIKRLSTELVYSKKSSQIHHRKLKRLKPYSDGEGNGITERKPIFKRSLAYYKSSSWQPKVVLFRISTNNMENLSLLPNEKSSEVSSLAVRKPANDGVDQRWDVTNRDTTRNAIHSGKVREYHLQNTGRIGNRADGIKRKKNRFRNLHTKKKIVPESKDQTKENKSAAENSSKLVDPGSDSDESSPSYDPPQEIDRSHKKSTKSSNSADDVLNRKSRADEEFLRNTKHDSGAVSERYREKRKRDRDTRDSKQEIESHCKRERSRSERRKPVENGVKSKSENNLKFRRETEKRCWVCEVCGFSKTSERMSHIQSHPFHCQSCHLAFKTETNFVDHLTRKHKDIRNQHHCLLCELSFDLEKDYYHHLETREHKHLESVEKNTINTLFRLLTGQPCPVLGPVESKPEWLPSQAGTVHFYHQATPLSLALQYLKLHHDRKKISTGSLSPSE